MSSKFVPHLSSQEQNELRLTTSFGLRDRANSDSGFLRSLITGDESSIYGYDPEKKTQSYHWKTPKSPRAKKARQSKSSVKVKLIVFFDNDGMSSCLEVPP